jgi:hypothetical protein
MLLLLLMPDELPKKQKTRSVEFVFTFFHIIRSAYSRTCPTSAISPSFDLLQKLKWDFTEYGFLVFTLCFFCFARQDSSHMLLSLALLTFTRHPSLLPATTYLFFSIAMRSARCAQKSKISWLG